MKKIIFTLSIFSIILSACTDSGKKAETSDARKVEVVEDSKAVNFNIIETESYINWKASHLGGIQPRFGKIKIKNANISASPDKIVSASFDIEMNSLTVESIEDPKQNKELTTHLKSSDFFNIEKYPVSRFQMTEIKSTKGEYNSVVAGNLTILDITKSITFNANINTSSSEIYVKSENFTVNRTDWNLTYNVEGTEGVPTDYLIANEIGFEIDIKIKK